MKSPFFFYAELRIKKICRDPDYAEYGGRIGTGTTMHTAPVP